MYFVMYIFVPWISVNIAHTPFEFGTCILDIDTEGTLSRNFDQGPHYHFLKCRNLD